MRPLKKEEMMLVFINEKKWIPGQARNDKLMSFQRRSGMTSKCHSGESRNPSFFRGRNFEKAKGFNPLLLKKKKADV